MDKTPITVDRSCQLSFTYEELVCHWVHCWVAGNKLAKAEPSGTKITVFLKSSSEIILWHLYNAAERKC